MASMTTKTVSFLFLLHLQLSNASVIFNILLLTDPSNFSDKNFSSLILSLTNATSLTLHSVESDTITGVQGKRLFAEKRNEFYNFQLLHVTRVRSSIEVRDESTAAVIIRQGLPHAALVRGGLGVLGIESVEIGEAEFGWQQLLMTTYLEFPSFVAQYLFVGWALTVLGFTSCIACYCCCCYTRRRETVVSNVTPVVPSAVVASPARVVGVVTDQPNDRADVAAAEPVLSIASASFQATDSTNTLLRFKKSTPPDSHNPVEPKFQLLTTAKISPAPPPVPPMLPFHGSSVGSTLSGIAGARRILDDYRKKNESELHYN